MRSCPGPVTTCSPSECCRDETTYPAEVQLAEIRLKAPKGPKPSRSPLPWPKEPGAGGIPRTHTQLPPGPGKGAARPEPGPRSGACWEAASGSRSQWECVFDEHELRFVAPETSMRNVGSLGGPGTQRKFPNIITDKPLPPASASTPTRLGGDAGSPGTADSVASPVRQLAASGEDNFDSEVLDKEEQDLDVADHGGTLAIPESGRARMKRPSGM